MLFKQAILDLIAAGKITVAFRKWQRPTVRVGGTLRTSVGVLAIDSVETVTVESLTEQDASRAGLGSLADLRKELAQRDSGELYRIRFHLDGPDPRIALREQAELSLEGIEQLRAALARLDSLGSKVAWTSKVLRAIQKHPGLPAGELAVKVGIEKERLKLDVRKLKELGLTESLHPGYRLSPRGMEFVRREK